ncbi:MAG: bifunctional diaminohydroxyphosphoribosylaminopyrimidine deaminase/5-amino-6-(5-phosphoribosylamino)uracil reductase RibD [Alphaproteobacteria bacterium]|nr:bifunctional diaminohydroxyphosphoribosylaminopyrimidine deaminase/5-amino-6-(5-phosphoribosylamino)uracil reductase RibD [Alphaproteobacteria bacterium]
MDSDREWMERALALAYRGLGQVWPNPSVGAVVVRDGRVVGEGWTRKGGRPHAETVALDAAGGAARGATLFVTLEPCAHHGKTPPCADAVISAGIARVVASIEDPDPRVSGQGFARLREAGIAVEVGAGAAAAREINLGFFTRLAEGRPMVTVKLATSLDGRLATHTGESQWISGEAARQEGHRLRADHDAIMVGVGTVLADDPSLTCRFPGSEDRTPVRIVVDSRLRLPLTSKLVIGARTIPTWVLALADTDSLRCRALADLGVEVLEIPSEEVGRPDIRQALRLLGERGLTRLLVEGGGRLVASLLAVAVVDRLVWFRAPIVIGGDGIPASAAFGVDRLAQAPRWRRIGTVELGDDVMETYARTA